MSVVPIYYDSQKLSQHESKEHFRYVVFSDQRHHVTAVYFIPLLKMTRTKEYT